MRAPLSRDRVIDAAITLADKLGAAGVTMRAIAAELGVQAMSLYNHVGNRDDVLDGMVNAVFAEIDLPRPGTEWKSAMRDRTISSRAALKRHPWAVGLMDSRTSAGPATLRHHDAVLGTLRAGGFSVAMAAHAFSLIDSYLYGFVLQELSLPFSTREEMDDVAGELMTGIPAGTYPHLVELMTDYAGRPDYDYADEFEYGLALILDALEPDDG